MSFDTLFMSFLLLCSFQRAFCFGFSPNHFAVPRNVRPRSLTTPSSLSFVTSRPSEKILCKTFCFDLFRLASLLLENARPRSSYYAFLAFLRHVSPFGKSFANASAFAAAKNKMVGLGRLELLTSRLSGVRSNQLSYRPI